MRELLAGIARACLGALAAALPRPLAARLSDRLPVDAMALPSALLPLALSLAVGFPAFLEYSRELASGNVDAAIRGAEQGPPSGDKVPLAYFSVLAIFTFATTTGPGLLALYLAGSGLLRVVGCLAGDPLGDPLLAMAHAAAAEARRRVAARAGDAARARAEGAEMPDLRWPGSRAGVPDATWVVLSSRRKKGWEEGVAVETQEGWYRLGKPFDLRLPQGLRRAYPLGELPAAQVVRRRVSYRLPGVPECPPPVSSGGSDTDGG